VTPLTPARRKDLFRACTDFVVEDDDDDDDRKANDVDCKALEADVALAEMRRTELERDLARATVENKRLATSNAALAAKNKSLKAELARLQRADTLKAVVEQNKALVERNKELVAELDVAHARVVTLDDAAHARNRDPAIWDGLLSERSQTDHLNARLLAAFLRNIDGAMETRDDSAVDWGEE